MTHNPDLAPDPISYSGSNLTLILIQTPKTCGPAKCPQNPHDPTSTSTPRTHTHTHSCTQSSRGFYTSLHHHFFSSVPFFSASVSVFPPHFSHQLPPSPTSRLHTSSTMSRMDDVLSYKLISISFQPSLPLSLCTVREQQIDGLHAGGKKQKSIRPGCRGERSVHLIFCP